MIAADAVRILIVDDDEGLRELARRRLQKHAYGVYCAGTLAEARTLLLRQEFDLYIIDYQLAESMTGLDFYAELRAQGSTVPAIMCSGFSDDMHDAQAKALGVTCVLPKSPDYLDALPALVERVLNS